MKTTNFIWIFLVIIQMGCDTSKPVREFNFSGSFETISTPLSEPPVLQVRITGEGTLTHLGRSSFLALSNIVLTPPPPFFLSGTSVLTIRGEEIHTEFEGTSVPREDGLVLVTMTHQIIGGTGKFTTASGSFTGVTLTDRNDPAGILEIEGNIKFYPD